MKPQTVLFRPLWPHQCSTDSEARITATEKFVTTSVASHLGLNRHSQEATMPCQECSNYRSSGLGVKLGQWRASVRVLNSSKAKEQYPVNNYA